MLAFSRRPSQYALTIRELLWWRKLRVIVGNDSIASRDLALYVPQPLRQQILKAIMSWLFPRATLFLAPSDESKRDLIENFRVPPDKIRVFKNWTRYVPSPARPGTIDLVYVGRVDPVKQLTRLVEIVRCVHARLPQLRVVVVGDGSDMANVRRRALEANLETVIEFVGFQPDVGAYLAQSKVFCLTSQFEGLPIAGLEAMAFGLPVVTIAYAGAAELVRTGETGFVCADEQAFCDRVVELLTYDARRLEMGARARALVQREHGAEVLDAYVTSFMELD